MKRLLCVTLFGLCAIVPSLNAKDKDPLVYVNKNMGFNIEGFQYNQPALPCDVDKRLAELLILKGGNAKLNIQAIETKEKIENGSIPVVLIDFEQLALGEGHSYGAEANFKLPKIQVTAGVLKNKELATAKHTCAIASLAPSSLPTDVVNFNHPGVSICSEAQKCLEDLSTDIVDWLKPQVQ